MADNRTMAELLQAPTKGYEDAIVIPEIAANNFELMHSLINLVQNKQFFGHDKEDPHAHIQYFNKITSTMRVPNVPSSSIKLMLFPFSLEGAARIWLEKEAPRSIQTWDDLVSKFIVQFFPPSKTKNLWTLPGNTITNLKEELKGITTRSGVAYQGPKTPSPSKQGTKVTKDQVQTTSSQNTAPVQPSVIQSESQAPVFKPVVTPVGAPIPNLKPSIPYPSRRDNEKRPLIRNKEKLNEMARTPMNKHCSAVILNKLPRKLGDPRKFLIPCEFPGMDECLALADLGASINLMPFSMWEALLLSEITLTCMTLELADRSVSKPISIAKDVSFKVGVFQFPADFLVVDFEPDPRVPLILERCFLKTGRALIDVHKGELTLRIKKEAITYNLDQTVRYSVNYDQMTANKIDVICEIYSQEVLSFSNVTVSGNPTPDDDLIVLTTSPTLTLFGDSDFLPFEEADAFLGDEEKSALVKVLKSHNPWVSPVHCVPKKGGFTVVENEENKLIPTRLVIGWRVCIDYRKLSEATQKDHFPLPFMDQMLKRLVGNEYYCFLDGFSGYFQIPIDPCDQEKTTFTCPYGTFAYRRMPFSLCSAPGTFQRCMLAIFHDMVEKTMEVFMDEFSVFGNSFENCLTRLDKMLQLCEDTNLSLNWEKSHFMVKEGIVLGHKISKNEIEVDKAKIDVIAKLPHPTTVKGIDNLDKFFGPLIPIDIAEEERIRREHTDYINQSEDTIFDSGIFVKN
nr:reverse transcriptase domain-containing protein [Tanacetum cinerariifolium]